MATPKSTPQSPSLEDQVHKKEQLETQNALASVMKKLKEANDKKNFEHADAQSLKKGLVSIMDKLRHDDKSVRKEALFALKQSRQQIQTLEEGALSNKQHIIEGLDSVIKASEQGSMALIGLSKEVETRIFKALPTTKSFLTAFMRNSNPLLMAAINVVGDIKGLYKLGKEEAKRGKDEEIKAQEDILAETIDASSEIADALQKSSKEMKEGLEKIDSAQNLTTSELQKQTHGINSLNLIGHGQTKVLSALLKTWDADAGDTLELASSIDILGEYVKGIKEGVVTESKANGVDPGFVKAILSGIDQEAQKLTSAFAVASKDDREKLLSNFSDHLDKMASVSSENTEGNQLLSKISNDISESLVIAKKEEAENDHKDLKAGKTKHENKIGLSQLPGLKDKEKDDKGLMGILASVFGLVGMFSSMAATLKTIQTLGSKVSGILGIAAKTTQSVVAGAEAGAAAVATIAKPMSMVGKALLKLAKISGVLTIITSAIDFFDGFTDAANVLDKNEKDLTFADKVASGLGGILGGFLEIFDMIGGWVGLTTGWSKDMKKSISKTLATCLNFVAYITSGEMMNDLYKTILDFVKSIPDKMISLFSSAGDYLSSVFGDLLTKEYWQEKLTACTDYIKSIPSKLFDMLESLVKGYLTNLTSMLPDALVPDKVKEYISKPTQKEHSKETLAAIDQIPTQREKFNGVVQEVSARSEFPVSFKARQEEIERMMAKVEPPKAATTIVGPTNNTVNAGTTIHNNAPLSTRNDDSNSFTGTMSHMAWGA